MAQQIDLEVAVLEGKLAILAAALTAVSAEFPELVDPAATGRAAVRVVRINRVTAQAALINAGILTKGAAL